MTIASALADLNTDIQNARTAITNKGGTITVDGGSSQLASDIGTITTMNGTTISITPTISAQSFSPSSPYNAFTSVSVSAVTYNIDPNIVASNIKSGVSILGVTGNVIELNGETKTINPSTTTQTITPSAGKNAITSATVNPVTASIDANIQAGNIKKDVEILGVMGTFEGGVTPTGEIKIKDNMTTVDVTNYATAKIMTPFSRFRFFSATALGLADLTIPSDMFSGIKTMAGSVFAHIGRSESTAPKIRGPLNFPDLTLADTNAFYYAFYNNADSITSVNFQNLKTANSNSFQYAFSHCTSLAGDVKLSELTTIQNASFQYGFDHTSITSFECPKLTSVSYSSVFRSVCAGCYSLVSVDFNKVVDITGASAFYDGFNGCSDLTNIDFSSLDTINGSSIFYNGFYGCSSIEHVEFPKLWGVSGVTPCYGMFRNASSLKSVHFPMLDHLLSGRGYFGYAFNGCHSSFDTLSFPSLLSIYISGTTASYAAFYYCTNIKKYYFPKLTSIDARVLFNNTQVTELHFGMANQSAVTSSPGYSTLWGRGAGAATVYFDLVNTITVGGVSYTRNGSDYDYTNGYYSWKSSNNAFVYTNKEYGQVVGDSVYTKTGDTYSASGTISAIA